MSALITDLYQLTMLQGYFREGLTGEAVFEFAVSRLPENWGFFVSCGLDILLDYLEGLRFEKEEIEWLAKTGLFHDDFLEWLSGFEFRGDIYAIPEGEVFFPYEPVVQVVAPLPQAQLIETRLINIMHYSILVATKAVRCVLAARGKTLVEFGLRRAHGAEAGLWAARASYIAGFAGTSNVEAGRRYGVPIYGTMAHSYVMAHPDEASAFLGFARSQKTPVILLIDTYDSLKGAETAAELVPKLLGEGIEVKGVRLDSGDLVGLSKGVRRILDRAGLKELSIFASGDLDEYRIDELLKSGAPIDGFGVGTRLVTAADSPYLVCGYKLYEYEGKPKRKASPSKATWPGRKQVYRFHEGGGISHDLLALWEETVEGGGPLLRPVMRRGERLGPREPLEEIRERLRKSLGALPPRFKAVRAMEP
ncbi:TPA: nicotinate phosphoribosyltransferase, partial [Candidatus Micrarchaeota archaeon]|nr:nicotinate phosphoribosyltransferase [Candidatus Micrarchaeota archaeon]